MSSERLPGQSGAADTQPWRTTEPGSIGHERSALAQSLTRIRCLMKKEFLQIFRNKQNVRMLIFAPLFQLFLFGYALRLDVQNVPTAVADLDRTAMSRQLIDAFSRSGYFVITHYLKSYDEADYELERGNASVALLIPPDFERRIKGDRTAYVGVLVDGVDTTMANTVSGYSDAIVKQFAADLILERISWARGLRYHSGQSDLIVPGLAGAPRAWFNPNLESRDFFIPGILAIILTFFSITLTTMALVREKETGTIEQLMVTPISRLELILGKATPSFSIALVNLVTLLILVCAWFQPPFRGSMVFFLLCSVLYLALCLGLGMTISAFCRTQQQAMLSSFMVLQPAVLLSGFVFPIENMPPIIQYITYINPLRYFTVITREVFLKGIGLDILWPQIIPLAAMAVGYLALASVLFKKRID